MALASSQDEQHHFSDRYEKSYPVPSMKDDVFIVDNFLQKHLEEDPTELMHEFLEIPEQLESESISTDPATVCIIPGSNPALKYRGNSINRHKIWAQKDYRDGLRAYRYSGWQWAIANATKPIENIPFLERIRRKLENVLPELEHNHYIATMYKNGNDSIGLHSDKDKDIQPDSWIMVFKLGPSARLFQFADLDGTIIAEQRLAPGAAIFMSTKANARIKHGVPKESSTEVGLSGSIVTRAITTVIPWDEVRKRRALAEKHKASRKRKRELKDT